MNCFSHGYHGQQYCSRAPTHDDDGGDDGVEQYGIHTPKKRLIETYSLGLPCTSLILDVHVMSNTCQKKVSADQYHVTILRAEVFNSSR